jgi:hypothetical protein
MSGINVPAAPEAYACGAQKQSSRKITPFRVSGAP